MYVLRSVYTKTHLYCTCQIDAVVGDYGLVVISRSGSNPEKFIYESDQLSKLQVNSFRPWLVIILPFLSFRLTLI